MAYPPPNHQSLHQWANICNVDEIVAQALHAIGDPVAIPVEEVLADPMPCDIDAIRQCCKQWMDAGYYRQSDTVKFRKSTLRVDNNV
mgnify:CR=1 FL=1